MSGKLRQPVEGVKYFGRCVTFGLVYDRLTADGIDCLLTPHSNMQKGCGSSHLKSGRTVNYSGPGGRSSINAQMSFARSRTCCYSTVSMSLTQAAASGPVPL